MKIRKFSKEVTTSALFVLLLVAWDLEHFSLVFQEFEEEPNSKKMASTLFVAHLKHLGILSGLGWILGLVALNIQIQMNFAIAVTLVLLMIFGLRQVTRSINQG